MERVTQRAARPSPNDRFLSYGPDPLRLLLVGNGIALGYGVRSRADTLDGRVGSLIAAATRRGIIVNNHTHDSSSLHEQALNVVAGMNLQTEDIVVWCPSYSEVLRRPSAGHWRRSMTTFIIHVSSKVMIVLVEVPAIAAADFDLHGVTRAIERINRALRQCAHGRANVAVCAPPAVEIQADKDHLSDGPTTTASAGPSPRRPSGFDSAGTTRRSTPSRGAVTRLPADAPVAAPVRPIVSSDTGSPRDRLARRRSAGRQADGKRRASGGPQGGRTDLDPP